MREECKHFESRTYDDGETVRKCELDLAPDAPWRCPENCAAYSPRLVDVNWSHGTLVTPPAPDEPPGLDAGGAELLDEAEDIVNAVGPNVLAEFDTNEDSADGGSWWQRWRHRR
jgi:hypothetical protein